MKKLITNYTFDASAKQVVFTDYNPVSLAGILLITNVTDNIIIYNFADPALGGIVATTTLTLDYDTTSMDDADKLQIWYDDAVYDQSITASSLPLPTGASTEAKQDAIIANLPINEVGRLKTSNLPADIDSITGTITGNGQTIAFSTDMVSNVMAHCYGTFSTINCTFEGSLNSTNGSDGNWFTIQAARTSTNTIETTTGNLSAAPAYGWELSVNAVRYMRVRSTAYTSGTQSWVFSLGSYATEPIPAIQTHAVTLGAAATAIAKAEDSAAASANVGVPPMIVRADSLPANAGTSADGDYAFAFCDNTGRIYNNSKVTESVLPTGASTEAKQDTIITHVDGIEGSVDGIEGLLTTIDADTGAIKTATELIDNAISGSEMQVDVVAPLPAGTNAIGKLAANSGVDIGDVDVLSLPALAAGTEIIGKIGHDITGIGHGVKTVTTAGTDVALATSTTCKKVDIQAQTDNTSLIAVGASGVDATVATGTGILLSPGDFYSIEIDNLADIYIDSLVNGEGVRFCYYT